MLPTTAGATYGDADVAGCDEHGGMDSPSYTKVVVYFGFGLTSALRDPAVCHEGSSCRIGYSHVANLYVFKRRRQQLARRGEAGEPVGNAGEAEGTST